MSYKELGNFYKLIDNSISNFSLNLKNEELSNLSNNLKMNYLSWLTKFLSIEDELSGEVIFVNSFYNSINLILKNLMLNKDLLLTYNTCDLKIYNLIQENKIRNHMISLKDDFNLEIIYNILKNKIDCNIFLYIEPYNQYPTTKSLTKERIDYIIHLCNQFDNFFVISNESSYFNQTVEKTNYQPLFSYSKNIISIISYPRKINKSFNFTSVLFKNSDYIKDELVNCVQELDYNLSLIDYVLLNNMLQDNSFVDLINLNKDENLKKYILIKNLLDENKIIYSNTKYLNNFWINFELDLSDETNNILLDSNNIKFHRNFYNKNNLFTNYLRLEYLNYDFDEISKYIKKIIKFRENKDKLRVSLLSSDETFRKNINNAFSNLKDMYIYQNINDLNQVDKLNQILILEGKNKDYYLEKLIQNKLKIPIVIINNDAKQILIKNYSKFSSISILDINNEGLLMINDILKQIDITNWNVKRTIKEIIIENDFDKIKISCEEKNKISNYNILIKHINFIKDNKGIYKDFKEFKLEISIDEILIDTDIKFYDINENIYIVCNNFNFDKELFLKKINEKYKKINGVIFLNEDNSNLFETKYRWECFNKDMKISNFNSNGLLALGYYLYKKNNLDEGALYGKNELVVDYYVTENEDVGLTLPDYNEINLDENFCNKIKESISYLNIVEIDEIKLYDFGSKHLILEIDKLLNNNNSDIVNMFGSIIENLLKNNNFNNININFMFYDHENEIIYNRTYENGILEESNCCPTGCVAAMIYYVNSYENDPETFKKDILYKNYNKIKTSFEDNTCFVETKVNEIKLEDLF